MDGEEGFSSSEDLERRVFLAGRAESSVSWFDRFLMEDLLEGDGSWDELMPVALRFAFRVEYVGSTGSWLDGSVSVSWPTDLDTFPGILG